MANRPYEYWYVIVVCSRPLIRNDDPGLASVGMSGIAAGTSMGGHDGGASVFPAVLVAPPDISARRRRRTHGVPRRLPGTMTNSSHWQHPTISGASREAQYHLSPWNSVCPSYSPC